MNTEKKAYTLSVLVEDTPGVLSQVARLFSRKGYNIESICSGPGLEEGTTRISVVTIVDKVTVHQIATQLSKLLLVISVDVLEGEESIQRELVLIKVSADESVRSDVLEIVRLFRVRVVDVNPESLTIEATGAEGKIDALLGLLEHYGIIELVRSGAVAVTRGPKALSEKVLGSEITGR